MNKGITGIYLAAGQGKRLGTSKLLPPLGKYPLGSIALMTALESSLDHVVVVTKETDTLKWIHPKLWGSHGGKWSQSSCATSVYGQAYSLKCGLHDAERLRSEAVIIMLADQPFISQAMINNLIDRYEQMKAKQIPVSFIAASRSGIPCPPILFTHRMFTDLAKLQGDMGARYLIQDKMEEGILLPFADPLLFFDVDTAEDYMMLKAQHKKEGLRRTLKTNF